MPFWQKYRLAIPLLLLVCIVSRVLTSIYYVEDIDCLRFALSAYNYDITEMRPHFPGYAVFCFFLKIFYLLTSHLAIAFSILGGIAIFLIIIFTGGIVRLFAPEMKMWPLVLLLFLNPELWLMGNSYMPDIFGLGLLMGCIYFFCMAFLAGGRWLWLFNFLTGLLIGTRLSYAPMLFLPGILLLWKYRPVAWKQILVLSAGILIWLLPLILLTGWHELIAAAKEQAHGHFTKWGGSVISSKAGWGQRVVALIKSAWADGMGGWWPGRGKENAIISVLLIPMLLLTKWLSLRYMWKERQTERGRLAIYLSISLAIYLLWIFFFQNVVHKPRHVMPVVPVICVLIAVGFNWLWGRSSSKDEQEEKVNRTGSLVLLLLALVFYSLVTARCIQHHFQPTAISQMKDYLLQRNTEMNVFVAQSVMGYYMEKHEWDRGEVMDIETDSAKAKDSFEKGYHILSTEPLDNLLDAKPVKTTDYNHDPYVNRMWAHLTLYEYQH